MFTDDFDNYACEGDTISCSIGDLVYTARITRDDSTTPSDFDCFDEKELARWKNDEWFFCGVVVECSFNGVVIGDASLWGVECNMLDNNDYLREVANDLIDDARANSREFIFKIGGVIS